MRMAVGLFWTILGALAAATAAAQAPPAPAPAAQTPAVQVPAGTLRYAILRNGDQIGTHSIEINRTGPETNVRVNTDLTVTVLFVTAYRLQHSATERWVKDQLMAFTSTTDNNGTRHKVTATGGASGLEVNVDGTTSKVDKNVVPESLWNPEMLKRKTAFNTLDGLVETIAVTDVGMEDLNIDGRAIKARHYALKGKFSQDVWYDERGRLVQVKLIGSDGSVISYKPI
jgi:Family of unknown function (DUF6134)